MFKLRQLSTLTLALGISFSTLADNWIRMQLVREDMGKTNNASWMTCTYEPILSRERQTITISTSEISCPLSIEYNLDLGKWRKG